ncbi:MAG: hypothetical protein UT09_C0042G0001 [Parcubacteria group bacterium GW2011_GWF2_38_8]|nr:MAG: hypothetical protein UT09_C0042G0001 [Parcubacteria group bacterium GW2011_GWF2_38_8]
MNKKESKDIITQALLLGFGLMDITKEKIEKGIKELKKNRNIGKKETEKVAKDFLKNIDKNREEVKKIINKQVKRVIDELGLAVKKGSSKGK